MEHELKDVAVGVGNCRQGAGVTAPEAALAAVPKLGSTHTEPGTKHYWGTGSHRTTDTAATPDLSNTSAELVPASGASCNLTVQNKE